MLHLVHRAVLRPSSEGLPKIVERDAEQAPESDKTHVRHDRRDVSRLQYPWRDEFSEAVTPNVLIDSNGDHERAGDGFV